MGAAAKQAETHNVLERVPFEKYCDMSELHATALRDLLVSPRLYKHRRDNPRADKDSLRVGRACHTAILEPDRFAVEYVVWRSEKMGRRYGKKWDDFTEMAAAQGQTILTEKQYHLALTLRDAAREHKVAGALLREQGRPELTVRWTHGRTGLPCKSRLDWLCSALVDIKTTRDPSPARFSTDAARYGYAMQLAFYADACAAAGLGVPPVKILAVQNVEPFDVVVFDLDEGTLSVGRKQYEDAIDRLLECQASGEWPGVAPDESTGLRLPAWAAPEAEEVQLTFGGEVIF